MNGFRILIALSALATAVRGAPDPGVLLTPGGDQGGWKPLVDTLAAKGTIEAPFTERRFFPFRREPTVLRGVIRISPERGLSLQYVDPEPSVLIADTQGLVLRDRGGRDRSMPAGSREGGAIASLLPIMRFDIRALTPRFVIHAFREDAGWRFEFEPRDDGVARSLGSIAVRGSGTDVTHLEFRRSEYQRVEIEVGDTRSGVTFGPEELGKFFR